MNLIKSIFCEDISKYEYFMSTKEIKNYKRNKIICACLPLILLVAMAMKNDWGNAIFVPVAMLVTNKIPYFLLSMRHTQNCNDVVSAIPLWVNHIYALIESNNIHNAIKNSLNPNTPPAIRNDLKHFIDRIDNDPEDKEAYLGFLKRYNVEGFQEIMLKLYEFRKLSKDKLKYEIRALNANLSKIEQMKRQNQQKNETFLVDTCTCFIIFVPCIYMTIISLMPTALGG